MCNYISKTIFMPKFNADVIMRELRQTLFCDL